MKKILFLLAMLIAFSSHVQYLKANYKQAIEIKKTTLLVGLDEVNQTKASRMKPQDREIYINNVEGKNTALKNAVEKFWKFNEKIEYMPYAKAIAMAKKSKEYSVLTLSFVRDKGYWTTRHWKSVSSNHSGKTETYHTERSHVNSDNILSTVSIEMPTDIQKVNLPSSISYGDVIYAVSHLPKYINGACRKKRQYHQ